ncbi:glycosyltransferase family 4 protein [Sphingomonas sp. AP4-R1]|uniref:glycosyltransferase n=1 Tax=Sphingomonas sp. AP4-R1 TaxID=2735134 RepID=UPI0014934C1A|nr:glycosyltransferase [Sphingomonas sp. AP4-R1]QJU57620.1 glycosyltransferase family 4 protein [Sphingomonas sp. AP4-R1]
MMHALIVSPIPSDPIDQGNAARIGRFCEMLQYRGYQVHFVYYGMEGLTEHQRTAMMRRWDSFHYVQPRTDKRQTRADGFGLDDYCGEELAAYLVNLQELWTFDICIVNYIWASLAATVIRRQTFCAIDTHDLFGGRHQVLQAEGVAPTWFYCSPAEEGRGLDRADCVIAIQDEEAKILAERTARPVITIGHILPQNFLPARNGAAAPFIAGYMASDNPSNRRSLENLIEAVEARPTILEKLRFLIAGRIAHRIPHGKAGFTAIGFVLSRQNLYRQVDLLINPNVSGTGLKIKTVEALSHGMPFVTTRAGMCGIPSESSAHDTADAYALVDYLDRYINEPNSLAKMRHESAVIFDAYTSNQIAEFDRLLSMARSHKTREKTAA